MKKNIRKGVLHRIKHIPLKTALITSAVLLFGTSAVTANHFYSQNKKDSPVAGQLSPQIKHEDSKPTVEQKQDETNQSNNVQDTPVQPRPTPTSTTPTYTPDPCPGLEKKVVDSESIYLKTGNDAMGSINKSIHDRYDSYTDSYSDLGAVHSAISEVNKLLDEQYATIQSNFTYQRDKGCSYSKTLRRYLFPDLDNNNPSDWFTQAQKSYESSWG